MPKKGKTATNGFSVYMQELRQQMMQEGKTGKISTQELVAIANPRWKELSEMERRYYNQLAKSKKKPAKSDEERLDNQGNVVAFHVDPEEEDRALRLRNKEFDFSRWPPVEDIPEYKFYWISFQTLCELEDGKCWLPCEVALVEWSMKSGITNTYHTFIDPGPIPLGYRYTCQSRSDDTHKIPIEGFELANSDYANIYREIECFVNRRHDPDHYPPIYSLHTADGKEWHCSQYCMEWLYRNAQLRTPHYLHKIYCLEDMVMGLYELAEQQISEASAIKLLTVTTWDYEKNTRCNYHESLEVKDCALAVCKRFAFALSDAMKNVYDFELTERHLPTHDHSQPAYTIISPAELEMPSCRNRKSNSFYKEQGPSRPTYSSDFPTIQADKGLWRKPAPQQSVRMAAPSNDIQQPAPQWVSRPPAPYLGRSCIPQGAPRAITQSSPVMPYSTMVKTADVECPKQQHQWPQQQVYQQQQQQQQQQQPYQQQQQQQQHYQQQKLQEQQHQPYGVANSSIASAGIGRARGRGQPRRATGGPGMTAPPSVTRTPLGLGRGISKSSS